MLGPRTLATALLLAAALAALPAGAQIPTEDVEDPFAGILDAATLDAMPRGLGHDPRVAAAWQALQAGKYVRARERAQEILAEDPDSIGGHAVMGLVQHRGEGNLPISLFHLKRSRELLEARYGPEPGSEAPWRWHAIVIGEMAMVSGEMGRHEDKIRYLLERDALYQPPWPADRGWPLMRLRRYEEARAAVEEAFALGEPSQVASAKTALCAIEAEQQKREEGYLACMAAADYERESGMAGPTPFTNAAEAALGMLRLDQAETLINEATRHSGRGSVSNPWLDLMQLYLAEGRTPEALDAMRRMLRWRRRQLPMMEEQNRAETEMASAVFLLIAGQPDAASRITARALARPDRTGFTSSESEQMEAAAALLDRLVNRTAAEQLLERASWSPFSEAMALRLEALRRKLRAWSSGRRAAAQLADERILLATLRPYLAGSIEIPEWIEPELCAVLGPGIVQAAIGKAREQETLAEAEGYFLAWEAEVAALAGRRARALEKVDAALETLPQSEVMLQARVAAIGAQVALDAGLRQRAAEYLDRAFQLDPGVIRRRGLALPAVFPEAEGALARAARSHLRRSPRLREEPGGFRVLVEGDERGGRACLVGPQGTRLACGRAVARAGEGTGDVARRLAAEFHAAVFAPRLDLTQADIRSLDGAPTAGGGRAGERLRNVLSELTAEGG